MGVQWVLMGFQWVFNGISMGFQWVLKMEIPWGFFHGDGQDDQDEHGHFFLRFR